MLCIALPEIPDTPSELQVLKNWRPLVWYTLPVTERPTGVACAFSGLECDQSAR